MKQITLTIISVLLICSSIFANDNISDNSSLHVFNSGDTISSSMMNDNFELLKLSNLDLMNQIKYLNDNISASNVKIEELQNLINKLIKYNNLDSDEINYIAVCEQGNILTSIDGISWKVKNIGSSLNITGISKGNGVYVAIGRGEQDYNESKIFVSSDTHTWMTITPPTTESLDSITFGKEMFITVGSRGIFTSLDGYSWNQVTSPTSRKIEHIEFGDNIFFTGGVNEYPTTYMKSSDGLNWEQLIFPENKQVNNIRYVNGYFYVVGDDKMLLRNKDLVSDWEWISINSSQNYHHFYDIVYDGNNYLLLTRYNIYKSSNGTDWEEIEGINFESRKIIFHNGKYIAVGNGGQIFTSTNTNEWSERASSTSSTINDIIVAK